MKIKVLEYKLYRGNHIVVHSHNLRKGKLVENKNWEWHNKVVNGETTLAYGIVKSSIKKYTKEINSIKIQGGKK